MSLAFLCGDTDAGCFCITPSPPYAYTNDHRYARIHLVCISWNTVTSDSTVHESTLLYITQPKTDTRAPRQAARARPPPRLGAAICRARQTGPVRPGESKVQLRDGWRNTQQRQRQRHGRGRGRGRGQGCDQIGWGGWVSRPA